MLIVKLDNFLAQLCHYDATWLNSVRGQDKDKGFAEKSVMLSALSVLIHWSTLHFLGTGNIGTGWLTHQLAQARAETDQFTATFPATVWSQFKLDLKERDNKWNETRAGAKQGEESHATASLISKCYRLQVEGFMDTQIFTQGCVACRAFLSLKEINWSTSILDGFNDCYVIVVSVFQPFLSSLITNFSVCMSTFILTGVWLVSINVLCWRRGLRLKKQRKLHSSYNNLEMSAACFGCLINWSVQLLPEQETVTRLLSQIMSPGHWGQARRVLSVCIPVIRGTLFWCWVKDKDMCVYVCAVMKEGYTSWIWWNFLQFYMLQIGLHDSC